MKILTILWLITTVINVIFWVIELNEHKAIKHINKTIKLFEKGKIIFEYKGKFYKWNRNNGK